MNSHTTTHTCTLIYASSCGIRSFLLIVNPTKHNAGQLPLHSSGSSHSNATLFSLSGGLGVHISVIWLLCSAVLQLWWHLGVAPLFLTVLLPTLLRPLVVSQDWGLCVSPHSLCTHEHWKKVLLEKKKKKKKLFLARECNRSGLFFFLFFFQGSVFQTEAQWFQGKEGCQDYSTLRKFM